MNDNVINDIRLTSTKDIKIRNYLKIILNLELVHSVEIHM